MALKFNSQVYLFEFKVVELAPKGKALQQIKDKKYADKYGDLGQSIHLIGVEFSKKDRNIVEFEVEQLSADSWVNIFDIAHPPLHILVNDDDNGFLVSSQFIQRKGWWPLGFQFFACAVGLRYRGFHSHIPALLTVR